MYRVCGFQQIIVVSWFLESRAYTQWCNRQSSAKSKGVIHSQRLVTFPTWNIDWALHTNTKYQGPFVTFMFLKIFYLEIATRWNTGVCKVAAFKALFLQAGCLFPATPASFGCSHGDNASFPLLSPSAWATCDVTSRSHLQPRWCVWRMRAWCPDVRCPGTAGVRSPGGVGH